MVSVIELCALVLQAFATVLLVKVVILVAKQMRFGKFVKVEPGPPGVPLLGNAWDLWVPVEGIIPTMYKLAKNFRKESLFVIWLGHLKFYFIQTGSAAESILKDPQQVGKTDDYDIPAAYLKTGLLTSPPEKWVKRRRMINPAFHFRVLYGFGGILNERAQVLVKNFEKLAGNGTFDLAPHMTHISLDIIFETTMGYQLNSLENCNKEFVGCLNALTEIYMARAFHLWLRPQFLFNLSRHKTAEDDCLNIIIPFTKGVIKNRKLLLEQEKLILNKNVKLDEAIVGKKKLALLDLLLEAQLDGEGLSDDDVLEEASIVMHAGHETTAAAMTWSLYLLGHHKEIQEKVQDEIERVLGPQLRPITTADLYKLKYLEAAIKEAMRLYPSVPIFARQLSKEVSIGDYQLPPGSRVYFAVNLIHRNAAVFPDPDKYSPERFYGKNALKLTPYQYLPFSAGPRNCIGHKLAMMEMKVVLAQVLHEFSVQSYQNPDDLKLVAGPVLQSVDGITVSLEKKVPIRS